MSADEIRRLAEDCEKEARHIDEDAELRECLREAISGIDEFMTRTIYRVHGADIERWRKALEGGAK